MTLIAEKAREIGSHEIDKGKKFVLVRFQLGKQGIDIDILLFDFAGNPAEKYGDVRFLEGDSAVLIDYFRELGNGFFTDF